MFPTTIYSPQKSPPLFLSSIHWFPSLPFSCCLCSALYIEKLCGSGLDPTHIVFML
ncbi:hypothetical protein CCACVL1_00031, partial [Corchorus capsularis]